MSQCHSRPQSIPRESLPEIGRHAFASLGGGRTSMFALSYTSLGLWLTHCVTSWRSISKAAEAAIPCAHPNRSYRQTHWTASLEV